MVADFTIIRGDKRVYMNDADGVRQSRVIPNMDEICPAYIHAVQWDSSEKIGEIEFADDRPNLTIYSVDQFKALKQAWADSAPPPPEPVDPEDEQADADDTLLHRAMLDRFAADHRSDERLPDTVRAAISRRLARAGSLSSRR